MPPFYERRPSANHNGLPRLQPPMSMTRSLLAAAVLSTVAAPVLAQAPAAGHLLVLSKKAQTLSIVDPTTLRVLGTVPVGKSPHEVISSADGATAYVSNYGYGAYNTLARVDLVKQAALPPIDLGPLKGPHGLQFVSGEVWFTAEIAKALGRFNPETNSVDWILGLGQNRTHMLYVAPDQSMLVATNVNSGTVSIVEQANMPATGADTTAQGPPDAPPRRDWSQTVVHVGKGPEGFDVSPSHQQAWVGNALDGTLSIIDLGSKQVIATIPTGLAHINRVRFTPDGKLVLVSTLDDTKFLIYDAATRQVAHTLHLGKGTEGILVQPDGARAYVSCSPDNNVAVIDLHTFTVVGRIDAGPEPDGLAWSPNPAR